MARAVNVILQIAGTNKSFDINKMGLINMSFDRMPVSEKDTTRSFMPEVQIQVMDKSGMDMMSILQQNAGNILLKYGYDDNLSETFKLTAVRIKLSIDDASSMVNIQAVGAQVLQKFDGEIYLEGTRVDAIIKKIAARNGWYIGDDGSTEYVDVKDIVLNRNVVKKNGIYDYDFIYNDIMPLLNTSISRSASSTALKYWEIALVNTGGRNEFYLRPYTSRDSTRRIWLYEHGSVAGNSEVIDFTNDIDMTFLLDGISLQIPMTATDSTIVESQSALESRLTAMAISRIDDIGRIIQQYNLPVPDPDNFKFNIEIVEAEDVGNKSFDQLLLEKLEETIRVFNTAELTVVGNPKIMPTDLIEFRAKNLDGTNSIVSSTGSSYWRVIGIEETIGLSGYKTKLSLVRESVESAVYPYENEFNRGGERSYELASNSKFLNELSNN